MQRLRWTGLWLAAALAWGCDDEGPSAAALDGGPADVGADGAPSPDGGEPDAEPPAAPFSTRAGVDRLAVWDAPAEAAIEVLDADGAVVREGITDALGSLLFREVEPGTYAIRQADDPEAVVDGLVVLGEADSLPDEAFYAEQVIEPGFGYLTTRDGTQLSIFVTLPGPVDEGPYPTVVNYSGYSPSQPGQALGPPADALCGTFPILCEAPSAPSALVTGLMGYATVGVNMRGTGCSGGAYDFFDRAQLLDGYDVIETVARQPWVLHNKVGMVGLSFPGISQLFVAAEQPPSLAAISPMSVIADTMSSTLLPGGIYNDGFALAWIDAVLNRAAPFGDRWVERVVEAGDTVCDENQKLHGQRLDATAKALANPFYSDEVGVPVDPSAWADRIQVPVFMTGQWQDEQTGPHFATLGDKLVNAPVFRMTATNGVHIDGFASQNARDWLIFLDLYVAQRVPALDPVAESLTPVFMDTVFGAAIPLPPNRFADAPDYATAKAAFEAEPPIKIIFESGADPDLAEAVPQGTFSLTADAWPLPDIQATRWYLLPDGTLGDAAPEVEAAASAFEHDPEAGARGTLASGSVNALPIDWAWPPLRPGHALAWISAPLEADVVMVGSGSVDLWIRSTADDADLEVTLSEVRPDGQESLVQHGWLRASHRALRDDATELRPVKSHRLEDLVPLAPGEWTPVRVELMPFGHVFHAGSQLRISVDTPGDSQADWRFILTEFEGGPPTYAVAHDGARPSSVVLPVIPGVAVPTERPACTALRGQPCRDYVELENGGAAE